MVGGGAWRRRAPSPSPSREAGSDQTEPDIMHPSEIRKIAFIGDYLPRKCGIATFTHDMYSSVAGF